MKNYMTHIEREAFDIVHEELHDDWTCYNKHDEECSCVQHRFALIEKMYKQLLNQVNTLTDEKHNLEIENENLSILVKDLDRTVGDLEVELEDTNEQLARRSRPHEFECEKVQANNTLGSIQDCSREDYMLDIERSKEKERAGIQLQTEADNWYRKVCNKPKYNSREDYMQRPINIPEVTMDTLDLYVNRGIPTGGFLYAVLTNDLFDAVVKADPMNRAALKDICTYVYNDLPQDCWGSRTNVAAWIEKFRVTRNAGLEK